MEPLGASDRMVFSSTSFAGDAVPLLFIDVEPVYRAKMWKPCARNGCFRLDRCLCIVVGEKGRANGRDAAAGHGYEVRTEVESMRCDQGLRWNIAGL
jgi:hypothetical protein